MYEATYSPSYLSFAIALQSAQDDLFWDPSPPHGYFASAPDQHVLIRLKDTQDGAEPSATSVSVHNLARLALYASDNFEVYEKQAEDVYLSIGEELGSVPRAWGGVVAGLMQLERGWREVSDVSRQSGLGLILQFVVTGPDAEAKPYLDLLRESYMPNRVVIRIDPDNPPVELGEVNATVKALLSEKKAGLRVCQAGVCGMPIVDLEEAARAVRGE
jgi:uncharacterized protein YyaL (SSP411 family)